MKTKIQITPAMAAWNAAVAEFDKATRYQFVWESDIDTIMLIAATWPTCSSDLAVRLAALRPAETKNEKG